MRKGLSNRGGLGDNLDEFLIAISIRKGKPLNLDLSAALEIAKQAAREAGAVLLAMKGTAAVHQKSGKDLVTDADLAAQIVVSQALVAAFPDHGFLGEEGSIGIHAAQQSANEHSAYRWVVDPLDGTTNYAHGLPQYAVSIALLFEGIPVLGVIYDPEADELFSAIEGQGAWLNDRPIITSRRTEISHALVAAGLSPNLRGDSVEIRNLVRMLLACQGLRRLGSAALNLCYVACGRLDGYWGGTLKIWDIAAGVLIVRQAGGIVADFSGDETRALEGALIASATMDLQRQLQQVISESD